MRPCRLILVADYSRPWNNAWFYEAGFEKNGHTVVRFDTKGHKQHGTEIVALAKEVHPDFVLHTKDEFPVHVFEELRRISRVIQWYPDPVIPEWLPPYVKECDMFLTMAEGLVDEFRKLNLNSFWLTQAFEPSFFRLSAISEDDRAIFSADVAFVGNLGSKPQYLSRRTALERVIGTGAALKWWGPKIPWKITNIPLVYGKLGRAYGGRFVWGEEYAKVARLSKIFLAFDSKPELRKSMSARMYTAVGCGAFYICRHVDGIEDVLVPDKEIVTFHTEDEMIDKIGFYLRNDDARREIAAAGKARVLRDHIYEVRIHQMCSMIEKAGIVAP
ncbi:MAG: glycosyltransferase family 1 protein [Nitrospirae bacterium]|nr:glycosyltransferase family 1 protein [Nitrospirota bacterium]